MNSNNLKKKGMKLFLRKEVIVDLERNGGDLIGGYCSGSVSPPGAPLCSPPEPDDKCTSRVLSYVSCLP